MAVPEGFKQEAQDFEIEAEVVVEAGRHLSLRLRPRSGTVAVETMGVRPEEHEHGLGVTAEVEALTEAEAEAEPEKSENQVTPVSEAEKAIAGPEQFASGAEESSY